MTCNYCIIKKKLEIFNGLFGGEFENKKFKENRIVFSVFKYMFGIKSRN